MKTGFLLGCNGRGVQLSSIDRPVCLEETPVDEQFRLVRQSGVFDYLDRLPLKHQVGEYLAAMAKYELPIRTASWFYTLGRDESLISANLRICKEIGAQCHNMMITTRHADGHVLRNEEVVECYLRTYDEAAKLGVEPSFELHVNMWSEDFRRVAPVAETVRAHGVPFNFTLDYSHVNFKIDNPEEQEISGVREDVAQRRLVLDPFEDGNLCDQWLHLGIVRWAQVRAVAPDGPKNLWWRDEKGKPARGIQYPFTRPRQGEWHSPWFAYKLEPTKEFVRKVLRYQLRHAETSRLRYITTEMINLPDYGAGARYNLFDQNVAIAKFVRETWKDLQQAAGQTGASIASQSQPETSS